MRSGQLSAHPAHNGGQLELAGGADLASGRFSKRILTQRRLVEALKTENMIFLILFSLILRPDLRSTAAGGDILLLFR
jgi:hypothetical protein